MFNLGSFLNPALLWLAAGALAPVIIHLATRSRPKTTPFPAVRFIIASQRSSSARFRLKQLLLLLLRMAVLGLFAFVVARPQMKGTTESAEIHRAKATVTAVILLDSSYSMACRNDGSTAFEKAKEMALAAVDAFSAGESRVCLFLVDDSPRPIIKDFGHAYDLDALRAHIEQAPLTARGTDCTAAVREAVRMLKEVSGVGKSVFLFTDLTARAWPAALPPAEDADDITFYIADAGPKQPLNAAVLGLTAPDNLPGGMPFQVEATLHNSVRSGRQVELVVDGERRDRQPVGDQATAKVALQATAAPRPGGEHWGSVTLTDQDDLALDNSRYFTLTSSPPLKAVLVNGAPSGVRRRDEPHFLRTALAPGGIPGGQVFELRELRPADIETADLGSADVIALCNVGSLSQAAWTKIRHFVSTGRGLIVFGGENVTSPAYEAVAQGATALLPCSVGPAVSPPGGTRLEPGRLLHPILRPFRGGRNGDLAAAAFARYLKLTPLEGVPAEVVARFKNDDPALVAGRYGTGSVLVLASTCDMDWNTLPREVAYVPLMHEAFRFLAAYRSEKRDVPVGQAPDIRIDSPASVKSLGLSRLPDGRAEDVTSRFDSRTGQLALPPFEQPGVYRLLVTRGEGAPTEEKLFAVNLDASESDLARLPEADAGVKSLLPGRTVNIAQSTEGLLEQISRSESVSELTSHLAGIVLVILLCEMYLSNRMRVRPRTSADSGGKGTGQV